MTRCAHCSAPLEDDVGTCTFCGMVTEAGRRLKLERARQEEESARQQEADRREAERTAAQQASAEKARSIQEAHGSANRSMMWSLLGLLACCLPLGPIVGIVMARRARELAIKNGTATTHALVAFIVGIGGVLLSVGGWGGIAWIAKLEADRKAELKAIVAKGDSEPVLSITTACALGELELLASKYEGFDNLNHELSCGTRLEQTADDAQLLDAHFTKDQERIPLVVCFHRAGRWGVSQVRDDARCDEPPPSPSRDDRPAKRKRAK